MIDIKSRPNKKSGKRSPLAGLPKTPKKSRCLTFVKPGAGESANLCQGRSTMKNLFIAITGLLLLNALWVLPGCADSDSWDRERSGLLRRATEMERRHCQIKASIDSLWDTTTARLERVLPASFPAADRDIFLKARNADHIRMFMSYKQLDRETQSLVDRAGQYDAALAAQMRALLAQKQAFERDKNQFLRKVKQRDTAASRRYAEELRAVADTLGH